MKRMFSFLVFLLLSSCVSELIASEEGYTPSWADLAAKPMSKKDKRRTRRKTERLRAAREKRAIDAHERKDDCAEPFTPTPPARRGRTAAIRKTASTAIKKRPPTPAHPSELQFPEVSRTNPFRLEVNESGPMTPLSPTSEDEEQAFGAFVQERAKEMASEAITHALDAKKDDGALNSDEEMEQAEAISKMFETKEEALARAAELATERDKLAAAITEKRAERDAKATEITTHEYNLYYTQRDADASFTALQTAHKASDTALARANKERNLQAADPDGTYYIDYYDTQFSIAQVSLRDAQKTHEMADTKHRNLVYTLRTAQKDLKTLKKEKYRLIRERNTKAEERKSLVAEYTIPAASYWSLAGYRSDDEMADSDFEEEVERPVLGCLTQEETLALASA